MVTIRRVRMKLTSCERGVRRRPGREHRSSGFRGEGRLPAMLQSRRIGAMRDSEP